MRDQLLTILFVPIFVVAFLLMTPVMIARDAIRARPIEALGIFALALFTKWSFL